MSDLTLTVRGALGGEDGVTATNADDKKRAARESATLMTPTQAALFVASQAHSRDGYLERPLDSHALHDFPTGTSGASVPGALGFYSFVAPSYRCEQGVALARGRRGQMEDFVLCHGNIDGFGRLGLYGVFDGHSGKEVARFAQRSIVGFVLEAWATPEGRGNAEVTLRRAFARCSDALERRQTLPRRSTPGAKRRSQRYWRDADATIAGGRRQTERSSRRTRYASDGSTVTLALVDWERRTVTLAHVGDSTAVVVGRDGSVVHRTPDHNCYNEAETARIQRAGGSISPGFVDAIPRLNGTLAVTRAFGDFGMRRHGLTSEPEVHTVSFADDVDARVLLIASDGLWDKVTVEEAAARTANGNSRQTLQDLCESLRNLTLSRNTGDNVSVLAVRLSDALVQRLDDDDDDDDASSDFSSSYDSSD